MDVSTLAVAIAKTEASASSATNAATVAVAAKDIVEQHAVTVEVDGGVLYFNRNLGE